MIGSAFRSLGKRVARKTVSRQARPGGLLDIGYGFRLLRDRRIPLVSKFVALAIGIGLTGLLIFLEIPLEGLLGIFLPLVGLAADAVFDGIEILVLPLLFACIVLPRLAPQSRQA